MDRLGEMVPQIEKMLPKLDSIMDNLNRLTSDPALAATLHNAQAITSNLKQTSEKLNVLMQNDVPVMLASLKNTSANAERFTGKLAALLNYQV